jgi:hypothetical protein
LSLVAGISKIQTPGTRQTEVVGGTRRGTLTTHSRLGGEIERRTEDWYELWGKLEQYAHDVRRWPEFLNETRPRDRKAPTGRLAQSSFTRPFPILNNPAAA